MSHRPPQVWGLVHSFTKKHKLFVEYTLNFEKADQHYKDGSDQMCLFLDKWRPDASTAALFEDHNSGTTSRPLLSMYCLVERVILQSEG